MKKVVMGLFSLLAVGGQDVSALKGFRPLQVSQSSQVSMNKISQQEETKSPVKKAGNPKKIQEKKAPVSDSESSDDDFEVEALAQRPKRTEKEEKKEKSEDSLSKSLSGMPKNKSEIEKKGAAKKTKQVREELTTGDGLPAMFYDQSVKLARLERTVAATGERLRNLTDRMDSMVTEFQKVVALQNRLETKTEKLAAKLEFLKGKAEGNTNTALIQRLSTLGSDYAVFKDETQERIDNVEQKLCAVSVRVTLLEGNGAEEEQLDLQNEEGENREKGNKVNSEEEEEDGDRKEDKITGKEEGESLESSQLVDNKSDETNNQEEEEKTVIAPKAENSKNLQKVQEDQMKGEGEDKREESVDQGEEDLSDQNSGFESKESKESKETKVADLETNVEVQKKGNVETQKKGEEEESLDLGGENLSGDSLELEKTKATTLETNLTDQMKGTPKKKGTKNGGRRSKSSKN